MKQSSSHPGIKSSSFSFITTLTDWEVLRMWIAWRKGKHSRENITSYTKLLPESQQTRWQILLLLIPTYRQTPPHLFPENLRRRSKQEPRWSHKICRRKRKNNMKKYTRGKIIENNATYLWESTDKRKIGKGKETVNPMRQTLQRYPKLNLA